MSDICPTYVGRVRGVHLPGSARPPMKASLVTRAAMSSAWGFSHRATMPSLDFFTASQWMLYACPKACGKSTCQHMLNICEKHFKHMQKPAGARPSRPNGWCARRLRCMSLNCSGADEWRPRRTRRRGTPRFVGRWGTSALAREPRLLCLLHKKNIRKMFQNKTKQQKQ